MFVVRPNCFRDGRQLLEPVLSDSIVQSVHMLLCPEEITRREGTACGLGSHILGNLR